MENFKKRFLSVFLAITMIIPTNMTAFADDVGLAPSETQTQNSTYTVHIEKNDNAAIYVNDSTEDITVTAGETVTVKTEANENYEVASISVKDANNSDVATEGDLVSFTFSMPESDVTVSASLNYVEPTAEVTEEPAKEEAQIQETPQEEEAEEDTEDEDEAGSEDISALSLMSPTTLIETDKYSTARIIYSSSSKSGPRRVSAAGDTVTISSAGTYSYPSGRLDYYWRASTSEGTYIAACLKTSAVGHTGTYTVYEADNDALKAAILLLPGNPLYPLYRHMLFDADMADNEAYMYIHFFASLIKSGDDGNGLTGLPADQYTFIHNAAQRCYEIAAAGGYGDLDLDDYKLFIANPDGVNGTQPIGWVEYSPQPKKGYLTIEKASSDTTVTNGNSNYSLEGAEFTVYSDSNCTNKVGTLKTNAEGKTGALELDAGTYYVKETTAPKGYKISSSKNIVTITVSKTTTTSFKNEPQKGYLTLVKKSGDTSITNNNDSYSLAEAKYGVYSDSTCSKLVNTLTTDAEGKTATIELPLGDYWIKETTASKGYSLDETTYKTTITANHTSTTPYTVTSTEKPKTGWARVLKISSDTTITADNDCYSLEGAVYGIYKDSSCTTLAKTVSGADAKLTTKADGSTDALEMPLGNYWVKEISASKNYKIDTQSYPITIVANTTQVVTSKETPGNDPIGVMLYKVDSVTGTEVYGEASLENAQYTVKYYDIEGITSAEQLNGKEPWGTWVFKTDENGILSLDANSQISGDKKLSTYLTGEYQFPIGTITVQETKAPNGYMIDDTIYTLSISMDGNGNVVCKNHTSNGTVVYEGNLPDEGLEIKEQAIRGDLEFNKKLFGVDYEMNNVTFTITNVVTGESHDIVTDESGYYSTSSDYTPHTWKTNSGKTSHCGVWFGYGDVDNEVGALPYGDYIVTEKDSGKYNYGTDLQKGIKFSIGKDENGNSNPEENGKTVSLGVIENKPITITTEALSATSGTHTVPANSKETVVETVTYTGLTAGREYVLKTSIIDYDTQDVLTTKETAFTPTSENGTVEIKFDIEAAKLAGKQLVIFEKLYDDGSERQKHESLADKAQTLYIPTVETSAADVKTTDDTGRALKDVSIIDHVTYTSVEPGVEYTVKGTLMDKSTGKAILDAKGKEITSSATFTPQETDGTVDVTFTFNGVDIEGKTTVVFESLYYEDVELAVHADLTDEGQTVYIPKIRTKAAEIKTTDDTGRALEDATITDTVSYENLQTSKEYTLKGILMDKETGKALLNAEGKEITATSTFKPSSANGTQKLSFAIDGKYFEGKTIVVYETLYYKGIEIANHNEIDDASQTVYIPKVRTSAVDAVTTDKTGRALKDVVITDTVSYENLQTSKEYTLKGVLMDKETGKAVLDESGKEITGTTTFTPKSEDGTQAVTFTFDGKYLEGKTLVVFEELYYKGIEIATHSEINDEAQTVYIPKIRTSAADVATKDDTGRALTNVQVTDTVSYWNLIPGKEYTLNGILMDKETGKAILDAEGQMVISSTTFTPEASGDAKSVDGTVDVTFTFDGVDFEAKTVVVYENLYYNNNLIATHSDLEDSKQTIYIPKIRTSAADIETDDEVGKVAKEVSIVDTVTYNNLIIGNEYVVKGTLVSTLTGEAILNEGGEAVTAETSFKAESVNGTVEVTFNFESTNLAGTDVTVFEELYYKNVLIAQHKDTTDTKQTINYPEIETQANDIKTEDHVGTVEKEATFIDTVEYTNLVIGKEYTITGTLMIKETNEPLVVDGKEITASKTFTAEKENGTIELTFTYDSSALAGETIVAFEKLYHNNVNVDSHEEITDEAQSVHYPEIETFAADYVTLDHVGTVDGKAQIIDTVKYENLIIGQEYTIKGYAEYISTSTADEVDEEGNVIASTSSARRYRVTAETTFIADKEDGEVDLTFDMTGHELAAITVSVTEKLYHNGINIDTHKGDDDENQKIHYPKIGTTAIDSQTKDKVGTVAEKSSIIDTVSYENLIAGQEYTVSGVLMDKETNEPILIDGKEVTNKTTFTPEEANGSIEVTFEFDSTVLEGKDVVVFETLIHNEKEVYIHADIEDENQTIEYPNLHTNATDGVTENHVGTPEKTAVVKDVVTYENLIVGQEYTVSGKLMLKGSNMPLIINGNEVTESVTFTAESANGSVELIYTFDATALAGETVVVFEDLIHNDSTVYSHADIEDDEQSVHYPKISTSATIGGAKQATAGANTVVTDTISYSNLVPGVEYTVKGTLMDKSTGKAIGVTAEAKFTPTEADGTIDITFTFDSTNYADKTLVVFEKLYVGENEVGSHEDIEDEAQAVFIAPKKAEPVDTGDTTDISLWLALLIGGPVAAFVALALRKRKI